jgi:hypothetical protein
MPQECALCRQLAIDACTWCESPLCSNHIEWFYLGNIEALDKVAVCKLCTELWKQFRFAGDNPD